MSLSKNESNTITICRYCEFVPKKIERVGLTCKNNIAYHTSLAFSKITLYSNYYFCKKLYTKLKPVVAQDKPNTNWNF